MTDYLLPLDDVPEGELRQGILLDRIPFTLPDLADFKAHGDGADAYRKYDLHEGEHPPAFGHAVIPYEITMGLVISSDCDLVEARGDNVLVAQVRPVAGEVKGFGDGSQPKKHAETIKNMNLGKYPNVFYIPADKKSDLWPASFADFHEIQRFANVDHPFLRSRSIAILSPLARELLRDRLERHFTRVGVPDGFGMTDEQMEAIQPRN